MCTIALFSLACVVFAVSPGSAQETEPTPIGVLDLTSELVPPAELRLLTDRLRHELVQTGRFRVMERERMQDILREQGFQQSECFATECVVEVGQLIGVQRMVAGSVGKIENLYTLSIRLIDMETGEVIRTAVKDCDCPLSQVLTRELAVVAADIAAPEPERTGRRAAAGTSQPTYMRGDIFTTVWTKSRSPYIVTAAMTVRSGNLLTIEPGVDVLFQEGAYLAVEGALRATGTQADSIRFIKGAGVPWDGIRISGSDSSAFVYTRISDVYSSGDGGGISVTDGARVSVANSLIQNNTAERDGGGVYIGTRSFVARRPVVYLRHCTISRNTSGRNGGGICAVAPMFGAGYFPVVEMLNCTIAGNTRKGEAGGLYLKSVYVTARNCIVWKNGRENRSTEGSRVAFLFSDLGLVKARGRGNINADPLFVDPANGDFHLRPGSPCIDAGDPNSPLDPDGTRADIGAFTYDQRQGRPAR